MKQFILNGRFPAQPLTGVQRFALEIFKRFANMNMWNNTLICYRSYVVLHNILGLIDS